MTGREILARLRTLPDHSAASLRRLRRQISKELRGESGAQVIKLASAVLSEAPVPSPAHRFMAYELIASHREAITLLNKRLLEKLGKGIDSWSAVDMFAVYLAGPAWREGHLTDAGVARWARSRDHWWRRAAAVSTVALNAKSRGGGGDASRTLAICSMLIDDRDDMVIKAMSWALRELAKRDPSAAGKFVDDNETNLAPRVVREVRNKLRTGLKNPRIASK